MFQLKYLNFIFQKNVFIIGGTNFKRFIIRTLRLFTNELSIKYIENYIKYNRKCGTNNCTRINK
jgi:hypothetical protein